MPGCAKRRHVPLSRRTHEMRHERIFQDLIIGEFLQDLYTLRITKLCQRKSRLTSLMEIFRAVSRQVSQRDQTNIVTVIS